MLLSQINVMLYLKQEQEQENQLLQQPLLKFYNQHIFLQ